MSIFGVKRASDESFCNCTLYMTIEKRGKPCQLVQVAALFKSIRNGLNQGLKGLGMVNLEVLESRYLDVFENCSMVPGSWNQPKNQPRNNFRNFSTTATTHDRSLDLNCARSQDRA